MLIAESNVNVSKQTEYIVTRLLQLKPGSFHRVRYQRPLKFRKAFEESNFGFKETEGVFRVGINYDATKTVQDKRTTGELPIENAGLKGFEWLIFPKLLKNKDNRIFARVYTTVNKPTVSYTLNGQPVDKEELKQFCLASEFVESKDKVCFNLDVETILEIN